MNEPRGAPAEAIVGAITAGAATAGLVGGGLVGWLIGYAFGAGRLAIPGLAPLVAGGPGTAAFAFAAVCGATLGLVGGVLGTTSETRVPADRRTAGSGSGHEGHQSESHGGHQSTHGSRLVQQLPIYGAALIALFMAATLIVIARRALGAAEPSDQRNRVTWNQKNATRVGGARDDETAALVRQVAYPATRPDNSPRLLVMVPADWRLALAATPLIARPVSAALVFADEAATDGTLGSPPTRLTVGADASAGDEGRIAGDPAAVAAALDARLAREVGMVSRGVIVVAADADARWALPAGAYAARTGTPILFVTRREVPAATAAALQRRAGSVRILVLGREDAVPEAVVRQLARFGRVTRGAGDSYAANAVRFAEFRDEAADIGWGRGSRSPGQWTSFNAILVNGDRWQDGVVAAHLARAGKSGPLLFTERERLPAVVDNYLWRQRPAFAATPAEGPFNHLWVVGSFSRVGYLPQAWADYSQEIEQYMTLGDSAASGFEVLAIGWVALSIASAFWILYHARRRLPDVMPMMKAAWFVFALLLGPVALAFYVQSYHRVPKVRASDGMVTWQRSVWGQTVSATVMMFGFDMMLMVLAVFALAYFGFPIVRSGGPLYILGSSMFLMMVLMYVVALVLMVLVFHTPMTMHERKIGSYAKALVVGFPVMAATMTIESLGMMPTMWWAQMAYLPGMQMPTEDEITMWATLLMAVAVGFLVVLPFNYWMVKRGAKSGAM
jgi:hypothetical protein